MKAPKAIPILTEKDKARFLSKVDHQGPTRPHMDTPCWVWTSAKCKAGYGVIGIDGGLFKAHRVAFVLSGGILTEEKAWVLHYCYNPSCCNDSHLWAGTYAENNADRQAKGRSVHLKGECHPARTNPERLSRGDEHYSRTNPERLARGDNHGSRTKPECVPRGEGSAKAKLTNDQVIAIRSRYSAGGCSLIKLAREHGVSDVTIMRIVRRESWRHIA